MNNLTINGIDYNAELELLKEYMREMIDTSFCYIEIDVSNLKPIEVSDLINTFRRTGLVLYNSAILDSYMTPVEPISFYEWKQNRAYESFWNRRDFEYFFPEKGYHHDNPMDGKWIDKKKTRVTMKTLFIILFCVSTVGWITEYSIHHKVKQRDDSVIDSLTLVTKQDSSVIHDMITLSYEGKHDQIVGIIKLNSNNFRQWGVLINNME